MRHSVHRQQRYSLRARVSFWFTAAPCTVPKKLDHLLARPRLQKKKKKERKKEKEKKLITHPFEVVVLDPLNRRQNNKQNKTIIPLRIDEFIFAPGINQIPIIQKIDYTEIDSLIIDY